MTPLLLLLVYIVPTNYLVNLYSPHVILRHLNSGWVYRYYL
jgi:hypothetical protein